MLELVLIFYINIICNKELQALFNFSLFIKATNKKNIGFLLNLNYISCNIIINNLYLF